MCINECDPWGIGIPGVGSDQISVAGLPETKVYPFHELGSEIDPYYWADTIESLPPGVREICEKYPNMTIAAVSLKQQIERDDLIGEPVIGHSIGAAIALIYGLIAPNPGNILLTNAPIEKVPPGALAARFIKESYLTISRKDSKTGKSVNKSSFVRNIMNSFRSSTQLIAELTRFEIEEVLRLHQTLIDQEPVQENGKQRNILMVHAAGDAIFRPNSKNLAYIWDLPNVDLIIAAGYHTQTERVLPVNYTAFA